MNKTRILIVDDDPSLGAMLAMEKLDANEYDAVLTDLKLGDMDGLEVLRLISGRSGVGVIS